MPENLFEAQYNLTKKSKIKQFYEDNKSKIFILTIIVLIVIVSLTFYFYNQKKQNIISAENYIEAKILISNKNTLEALELLKKLVISNNKTYSALSFFLILDNNLIEDQNELTKLFDNLMSSKKYDENIKNLFIYKKALFSSNFLNESDLLNEIKPLLNNDTLWKPHALLLLGDYFFDRNEFSKAKEFYIKILSLKNLENDFYNKAQFQLNLISNE
jgi:predicted negative regulator of RcsB-dependent stress response